MSFLAVLNVVACIVAALSLSIRSRRMDAELTVWVWHPWWVRISLEVLAIVMGICAFNQIMDQHVPQLHELAVNVAVALVAVVMVLAMRPANAYAQVAPGVSRGARQPLRSVPTR